MDLDAMHKDVTGIKRWKAEVQMTLAQVKELASRFEQMSQSGQAPDSSQMSDVSRRVDDLSGQVAKHEGMLQTFPNMQAQMAKIDSVEEEMTQVSSDVAGFKAKFPPEQVDALAFMLTWFQDNREGLDELLSLGTDDQTGNSASSDTAASGDGSGRPAGAASGVGETDTPTPQPVQASGTTLPVNPNPASPANPLPPGAETLPQGNTGQAGASIGSAGTTTAPADQSGSTGL